LVVVVEVVLLLEETVVQVVVHQLTSVCQHQVEQELLVKATEVVIAQLESMAHLAVVAHQHKVLTAAVVEQMAVMEDQEQMHIHLGEQ
jgi:hypothetical protein